jgi:23S rRNA pseudouridine1911/1915/1917 synthase
LSATKIEVGEGEAGQRLDRFLAERLAVSRARVRHLLEFGRISLAGRRLELSDKSRSTATGDCFVVTGSLRARDERPTPRPDLDGEVLAEAEGWLVVHKPAGRAVHPLHPDQDDTVLNAVVARYPEIVGVGEGGLRSGIVHRLDVDTSGALLLATAESWRAVSRARVESSFR